MNMTDIKYEYNAEDRDVRMYVDGVFQNILFDLSLLDNNDHSEYVFRDKTGTVILIIDAEDMMQMDENYRRRE